MTTHMITLEVTTNHYVVAAVSRSYFPRWFHAKAIAPSNDHHSIGNHFKEERKSESRQGEHGKTTPQQQQPQPTNTTTAKPQHVEEVHDVHSTNDNTTTGLSCQPDILGLSLMERASVQAKLGKYQTSMELLEKAIHVQRQELGVGHVSLAQTLSRRASIQCHFGDWDAACADLKKAVQIAEAAAHEQQQQQQQGPNENQIRLTLADLLVKSGLVHLQRGHLVEGIINLEKALAIKQDVCGASDAQVADLICLMAGVHHQQHDYVAAASKYNEALAIYKAARVPKDDARVIKARRQSKRRSLLGHGFWSSSNISGVSCSSNRKQSACV